MDIFSLTMVGLGAFGAGLTLGAMTMSPRCGPWRLRGGPEPKFQEYQVTQTPHSGMISYSGVRIPPAVILTDQGPAIAYRLLPEGGRSTVAPAPAALPSVATTSRLEVES